MNFPLDEQLTKYVSRHRRTGIMLDTNVLLLFIFAAFMPERIEGSKRLTKYDRDSGQLLLNYVQQFDKILTTPHVLAETSNLARQVIKGRLWNDLSQKLYPIFCLIEANGIEVRKVDTTKITIESFTKFGLTDAAIVITIDNALFLTDDLNLYLLALSDKRDALNFTHMRQAAGNL